MPESRSSRRMKNPPRGRSGIMSDICQRKIKLGHYRQLCLTDLETIRQEVQNLSRPRDSVFLRNYAGRSVTVRAGGESGYVLAPGWSGRHELHVPHVVRAMGVLRPFLTRDAWPGEEAGGKGGRTGGGKGSPGGR